MAPSFPTATKRPFPNATSSNTPVGALATGDQFVPFVEFQMPLLLTPSPTATNVPFPKVTLRRLRGMVEGNAASLHVRPSVEVVMISPPTATNRPFAKVTL